MCALYQSRKVTRIKIKLRNLISQGRGKPSFDTFYIKAGKLTSLFANPCKGICSSFSSHIPHSCPITHKDSLLYLYTVNPTSAYKKQSPQITILFILSMMQTKGRRNTKQLWRLVFLIVCCKQDWVGNGCIPLTSVWKPRDSVINSNKRTYSTSV